MLIRLKKRPSCGHSIALNSEPHSFLIPVATEGPNALLPLKQYIHPIISDCWKTYNCLSFEDYVHLTVNHSYNVVDPDTITHIQHIELLWKREVTFLGTQQQNTISLDTLQNLCLNVNASHKSRIHHMCKAIHSSRIQPKLAGGWNGVQRFD